MSKENFFFGKDGNHPKSPGFRVLVTQGTEGFLDFGTRALGHSIGVWGHGLNKNDSVLKYKPGIYHFHVQFHSSQYHGFNHTYFHNLQIYISIFSIENV